MVVLQQDGAESLQVFSSMSALAFLAVLLRIFARLRVRNGLAVEDFLIIAALCPFYSIVGLFFAALFGPNSSGTSELSLMALPDLEYFAKVRRFQLLQA